MKQKGFDWTGFKRYVNSYDPKRHGLDNEKTIQEDMIYGVGKYSVDDFEWASGYLRFRKMLLERWGLK